MFLSLQVRQSHLYPTLLVLHGILISSDFTSINSLFVHRGHDFWTHFDFLNGFLDPRMSLIFSPPFSSILILSEVNLFNSASLFCSSFARTPPGVGVTNRTLLYWILDFSVFHQLTRQANEAVRIHNRPEYESLNSKSEFNHPPVARVVVDRRKWVQLELIKCHLNLWIFFLVQNKLFS